MAAENRSEVTQIIRANTLWDKSNCCHIPGIEKHPYIEEVLDCLHYVFPDYVPSCFKESTIVPIKT